MRDCVAALPVPRDGGALLPGDSGDHRSGHATAQVSRQVRGCHEQVGNGIVVAATTGRARAKSIASGTLVAGCFSGPDDKPVKHELDSGDLQVRSGLTIQREPPSCPTTLQRPQQPCGHRLLACTTPREP
ncbi:hypothetical protein [Streptomyces sp. NPDC017964]|uniref:hypothetical protein n=1 Tax=Streptomyces sp. NPDC017964 TaxID=3365022 RepID=UPI0037BCBCE7